MTNKQTITFRNKNSDQIIKLQKSNQADWGWKCSDKDSMMTFIELSTKFKNLDKELKENWEEIDNE